MLYKDHVTFPDLFIQLCCLFITYKKNGISFIITKKALLHINAVDLPFVNMINVTKLGWVQTCIGKLKFLLAPRAEQMDPSDKSSSHA